MGSAPSLSNPSMQLSRSFNPPASAPQTARGRGRGAGRVGRGRGGGRGGGRGRQQGGGQQLTLQGSQQPAGEDIHTFSCFQKMEEREKGKRKKIGT
jgi:hypothetical protein